jgi:hypothetical protein
MTAGAARTIPGHGASGEAAVSRPGGIGGRGDLRGRTLLVAGDGVELAVALRDRLDRAYITVCDVRSDGHVDSDLAWCPWPWMVVGDSAEMSSALAGTVAQHPVLVLWHGVHPRGLPAHTRAFGLFSELARAVSAALNAEVGGMRLAPGTGLTMPDGTHCGNAALEALVANHPHPVFAPMRDFRGVVAALASHRVPLLITHDGGGVSLAPAQDD